MKLDLAKLSHQYQAALKTHLVKRTAASLKVARDLGQQAVMVGLETLDIARIHERALISLVLSKYASARRAAIVRRASAFFAEAITPIAKTHRAARDANATLKRMVSTLGRRSKDLILSNRELKKEIVRRRAVEGALRSSERHYSQLLDKSQQLQEQLRRLSRQLLTAQEEERKMISRELHDEIAQTLTGINVRLSTLKQDASVSTKDILKKIASTQRMVEKSVDIVHRFARELRPTVLDDLGLIPALHSFVKSFSKRTRLRVDMRVFAGVEHLEIAKRTVLYRVAQEALTNVAKHAKATHVNIEIQKSGEAVCMLVRDNGKSFELQRVLRAKGYNRLGLLGMRERVEMVGGTFSVDSKSGRGTSVHAEVPISQSIRKKRRP